MSTLDELSSNDLLAGMPEGHAYLALSSKMNLDQFKSMLKGLKKLQAIKVNGNYITKGDDFDEVYKKYTQLENTWDEKLKEYNS
jgi:hypothetical protein